VVAIGQSVVVLRAAANPGRAIRCAAVVREVSARRCAQGTIAGGSEIKILNAVGYDLKASSSTPVVPEPNTLALLGSGMACIGFLVRRRRSLAG
jgi:hypothetical protein